MSAAFTPGPWRVGADLYRVHPAWRDEDGNIAKAACHKNGYAKTIATVANENHDWRDIGAQVADARLIAAAPEMFAALLEACLALETPARCVFNDNGDHTITNERLAPEVYSACYYASRTVKEALAKARGEQ